MADPWIRMRVALAQDPTVLSLGLSLGTSAGIPPEVPRRVRRRVAVGMLLETWGLFHLEADAAGLLAGYTLADIDEHVGVTGWGQAMVDVGWLVVSPAGVTACGFDRYIGSKKANQDRERSRKRAQRAGSGVSHPLSRGTTPGTSRGTSAGPSSSSSSSSLSSDSEGEPEREPAPHADDDPPRGRRDQLDEVLAEAEFAGAPPTTLATVRVEAERWRDFRREAKLGAWTATTWRTAIRKALADPAAFASSVGQSIANGWQGLFPPRAPGPTNGVRLTAHEQANQRRHAEIGAITDFLLTQFPDSTTPALIEGAKR